MGSPNLKLPPLQSPKAITVGVENNSLKSLQKLPPIASEYAVGSSNGDNNGDTLGDKDTSAAVMMPKKPMLQTRIDWTDPAPIWYGLPLSPVQLNASVSSMIDTSEIDNTDGASRIRPSGNFEYIPPLGTLLLAGDSQELSVRFIPLDSEKDLFYESSACVRI